MNKHVLLVFGVDHTDRDVVMVNSPGFRPSLTSYTPSSVTDVRLVFVRAPSLHRSSITKPRNMLIIINAIEFPTKVCFSLFDGSEVLAQLMSCMKGNLCNVWHLRNFQLT